MEKHFDVVIIGAGHAGVEATQAVARLGKRACLLTLNLDSVSFIACNPSIGGTSKAHLVMEIDALGGLMGQIADETAIQIRMLNRGKGSAVQSLRAQVDKRKYHATSKHILENLEGVTLRQGKAVGLLWENKQIIGVRLQSGEVLHCRAVVVATGVYLNSQILIGDNTINSGPSGFNHSGELSESLKQLGMRLRRFKTGTPPRVNGRTIDYAKTEIQHGEDDVQTFSFLTRRKIKNLVTCHLTWTNEGTHQIIRDNLDRSPMYQDTKRGIGPRYCPSIEDKVVRFPDKDRHQVFLEPESLDSEEIYLQGLSTSMPTDVQEQYVKSIEGLANVQIMRDGYAIEYDCIDPTQLESTLEFKGCRGLYFAGQINGTSGYEEAAAQGLVAGINATLTADSNTEKFVLSRTNSYIGVLIDDLVTKGTEEPYRMMTGRAEHRLFLRQDNADIRMTPLGRGVGLVCDKRWKVFQRKLSEIERLRTEIKKTIKQSDLAPLFAKYNESPPTGGMSIESCVRRVNITLEVIRDELGARLGIIQGYSPAVIEHVNIEVKYEGYLKKELERIDEVRRMEDLKLSPTIDYSSIKSLRLEARTKLNQIKPTSIGQATRISGVNPADINVLLVWIKSERLCAKT